MRIGGAASVELGVDVGGTKILAGVVDEHGVLLHSERAATPSGSATELARAIAESLAALPSVAGLRSDAVIGLTLPGRVSGRNLHQAANLGLADVPMADLVQEATGHECVLINDADAALLAEQAFGAARGAADAFLVSVGTGIGGSHMIGGVLMAGAHGAGNEVGHVPVRTGGRRCGCGGRGCLDQYGSGRALARYALAWHQRLGVSGEVAPDLARAASCGDAYAIAAFDELAAWLALGIADVVALVDPELILLAGGVASAGETLCVPLRAHLGAELARRGIAWMPEVVQARFAEDAGVIGAAAMARRVAADVPGKVSR